MKSTQATITLYFGEHSTSIDSGAEDDYRRGAALFPSHEDAARDSYATYKEYADDLEIPEDERDTLEAFLNPDSHSLGDHYAHPEMPQFHISEIVIPLDSDWKAFRLI